MKMWQWKIRWISIKKKFGKKKPAKISGGEKKLVKLVYSTSSTCDILVFANSFLVSDVFNSTKDNIR